LGYLRRLIDHQGDSVLEQGIAELLAEGELQAHLKRARKIYRQRRDLFCDLLHTHLTEWFSFKEPQGGMAVWGQFAESVDVLQLGNDCYRAGLGIPDGRRYQASTETRASHLRLGFAAQDNTELVQSVRILEKVLQKPRRNPA
jgi:GntR family transcriptional regulator/MocR family aminotransferase